MLPYVQNGELLQVMVPEGTIVFVGIAGSNRSELVWGEDAKQWKPERWLDGFGGAIGEERLPGIYSGMYVKW
jgi:cytochrome P450